MSRTTLGPAAVSRVLASVFTLVMALAAGACDKVPLFAPSSSTITLTINRTTLPINGTAEVTATVIESAGTSVQNGTLVTFVSNLGTFDPPEVETQGGRARTTFLAGTRSGTAQLSATSGGNRAENVEVLVGAAGAQQITVRAEPPSVPVTGGSVQVTSVVTDVSGNPLSGAQVVFSSNAGTLSSSSGLTNDNGEARVTLTTNRETEVTARVAAQTGTVTIRANAMPQVTITGPAAAVTAGSPAAFTLSTPAPQTGTTTNPIVSLSVDFGDGTTRQVSPGTTSVTHVYNIAGTYVATARATDSAGQTGTSSTSVVVTGSPITPNLIISPTAPRVGTTVLFDARGTTGPSPFVEYRFSFGDASPDQVGTSPTATRVYAAAGTYVARVTIRDSLGRTATTTTNVTVAP